MDAGDRNSKIVLYARLKAMGVLRHANIYISRRFGKGTVIEAEYISRRFGKGTVIGLNLSPINLSRKFANDFYHRGIS